MNIGKWARVMLAAAPLLAGCSGFWDKPTSSSTTTTTTTLSGGYFYLLDTTTSQIIAYDISSGTLTETDSEAVPSAPIAVSVAPNKKFLYVSTLNGIYLYAISSGTLALNSSAISNDPATAMQVDSTSSWLVEASGSGYLYAIPISPTDGTRSSSSTIMSAPLTGTSINQLDISPNNKYVFVAAGSDGIAAFSFTTGGADPLGTAAYATFPVVNSSAGSARSVAVDPSNRIVYVGETAAKSSSGGLRAFTLSSSGALNELSGSPYSSGGPGPYSILPKSTGDYVYVANWEGTSSGNITGFSVTESNSVLSLTKLSSSVATGVRPMGLVEDSSHNFVLAVSAGGSPYFDAYIFDASTAGALDTTITSSTFAATAIGAQ